MFTDFRNRLTYFGTLDDVVYRYPWPSLIDLQSIQQQLVTSAIYDKKILINDGYLITNPQLLGQLQDIDRSLVGNLLMTGAARLFARGGKTNLAEGIENGASRIATHAAIVRDAGRWRVMRDDLEFLSGEVEKYTLPWPADKNMGAMFHALMKRVRGMNDAQRASLLPDAAARDFDAVFDRFDREIQKPSFGTARSVWEDQCWIYYARQIVRAEEISALRSIAQRGARFPDYERVRLLMNVANEVYHLAYAVAAFRSLQTSGRYPGVDPTAMGVSSSVIKAFPDLLGPEIAPGVDEERKAAALNEVLITIPTSLKFKDDFFFVTRLTTNGECRRTRSEYLRIVAAFIEDRVTHQEALDARNAYASVLARQLEPGVQRWWLEYLVGRIVDVVTIPIDAVAGAGLLRALASALLPIGVDRLNTLLVERLVQAKIGEDGIAAAQGEAAQPLARRLGLYLGPLKSEGSNAFLKEIAPPG